MSDRPRIVDVVFRPHARRSAGGPAVAVIAALAAHLFIVWWAERIPPERELPPPLPDIQLSQAPPPKPQPPRPPASKRPPKPPPKRVRRSPPPKPQPPARVGKVIAQAPDPPQPVNMTSFNIVTGSGAHYAGGATTATGTNKHAVKASQLARHAPLPKPAKPRGPDRSRPVALATEDWSCPWPASAEATDIDDQVAVVRVVVKADGTPASARVVSDPGNGFGPAAVVCAMRASYRPAHNRAGHPIRALSPPIQVRFSR